MPWQQGMWLIRIVSKNLHTKYELNATQNKGVIEVLSWLPWQLGYHSNEAYGWCLSSQRTSLPNLKSVRLKTKELLRFHSGCHGIKISLVLNRNVVSAARDLVPTSKKPLPFTNWVGKWLIFDSFWIGFKFVDAADTEGLMVQMAPWSCQLRLYSENNSLLYFHQLHQRLKIRRRLLFPTKIKTIWINFSTIYPKSGTCKKLHEANFWTACTLAPCFHQLQLDNSRFGWIIQWFNEKMSWVT